MNKLFDSHAHYNDPRFDSDRDELLAHLTEPTEVCPCGVEAVVNIGCCIASSRDCVALTEKYPYFYAAVGIHPQDADTFDDSSLSELEEMLKKEKVVAIGEIGLDYKYENAPREKQKEVFRYQMELASKLGVPVSIHDRDAHGDVFDIIREFPGVRGVMHSYSGSGEMARQLIKRDWFISFSGSVTFKNASGILKSAESVPVERLMTETDCPFLAPVPFRGQRNDSRLAYKTVETLAAIKGTDVDKMLEMTSKNAKTLFNLLQK